MFFLFEALGPKNASSRQVNYPFDFPIFASGLHYFIVLYELENVNSLSKLQFLCYGVLPTATFKLKEQNSIGYNH